MAYRWSLTQGAYDKYSYIFEQTLPAKIIVNAAISEASYIRDVIRYANENNLKGADWYKKVKVSAQDQHTIIIADKVARNSATTYPQNTIFDLINMHELGSMPNPYTCYLLDGISTVQSVLEDLGYEVIPMSNNVAQIRRPDGE